MCQRIPLVFEVSIFMQRGYRGLLVSFGTLKIPIEEHFQFSLRSLVTFLF